MTVAFALLVDSEIDDYYLDAAERYLSACRDAALDSVDVARAMHALAIRLADATNDDYDTVSYVPYSVRSALVTLLDCDVDFAYIIEHLAT